MDISDSFERMAVLIDADNAQLSKLSLILEELSTYGRIVVKRAYGNWKDRALKNWEEQLKTLAIKPEQHDFLYFVAVTDGGEHVFSTNLADHNKAVRQYLQNRRKGQNR